MQAYDLIVIGSGPGGQRAAIQAAKSGKRVAVIEKRAAVGGVCINTGTIPSKTMREAVLHLSGFYYQNFYGANYHVRENVTMADLNYRVSRVIENEVAVIQAQLQRNGVDVMYGMASFLDAHRVQVENGGGRNEIEGANILIATGTKPAVNAKVPVNGRNIIDSDQILSMAECYKAAALNGLNRLN
jgi:NAD(P) transhydrogenase